MNEDPISIPILRYSAIAAHTHDVMVGNSTSAFPQPPPQRRGTKAPLLGVYRALCISCPALQAPRPSSGRHPPHFRTSEKGEGWG